MKKFKQISKFLIFLGIFMIFVFMFYDFIFFRQEIIIGKKQILGIVVSIDVVFCGWLFLQPAFQKAVEKINNSTNIALEFLNRKLHFLNQFLFPKTNLKNISWVDRVIVVGFAVFAILSFLSRWNGIKPFIDLEGDGAAVAGYAASLDRPDLFVNDFLLSESKGFSAYPYAHVPLVRFLNPIVNGYGTAYLVLLSPIIFIQLLGFYIFGRMFYNSRFWALLLAILSSLLIYTASSDYWGFFIDPQPRMLFQAFFPFVLILAYISRKRPVIRWFAIILIGLLSFFHPNSIPAVAFTIWLGFLLFKPSNTTWGKHIITLFLMGLLFLLIASPVFYSYLQTRQISSQAVDYTAASQYFGGIFKSTYNAPSVLTEYLKWVVQAGLLPMAALGLIFMFFHKDKTDDLVLIICWIVGIVIIAIVMPTLELKIDSIIKKLPVLLQLSRNLRYTIPLLELLALWPGAYLWNRTEFTSKLSILIRSFSVVLGISVIVIAVNLFQPTTISTLLPQPPNNIFNLFSCWRQGNIFCPSKSASDQLDMIEYIGSNTPIGSRLISVPPVDINGAIRYQSLRPLVLTPSDVKKLSLNDISLSMNYSVQADRWKSISQKPREERYQEYFDLGKEFGADYLVFANPLPSWLVGKEIYSNSSLALIKSSP